MVDVPPVTVAGPPEKESGVTYGILNQHNDAYDGELIEKIEAIYKGGFEIQRKARKYLTRLDGETEPKFRERASIVAYIGFFSQIVDQFVSDVFTQPLSVKPAADADDPNTPGDVPDEDFYSSFEKNADKRGTSFIDLMTCTLRTALKQKHALVMVDAPDAGAEAGNLYDEDKQGARRLYAYECPIERLIDWECDDETGRFRFAILYDREQRRPGPYARRDKVHETFTVWTIGDEPDATAEWVRYGITYDVKEPPTAESYLQVEARGGTSFNRIPILRFELPDGLWVGNKVGPQAIEHWQRRSALIGAENRSLVAIPYVELGPQAPEVGGAIPADVSQNQSRGERPLSQFNSKGWLTLAAGDKIGFAEPAGGCYELVDQQLEKLREMMFQVTFQMASSVQRNNTSMGRSGMSKQKDEDLTSRVLRALGHCVRDFSVEVFDTISQARGEDVHWTPHGLDGFDSEDREALLEEAVSLDQVAEAIPSETFHLAHARSIVEKLLKGTDVQTMATIIDELTDGIHAKHEMNELKVAAEKDELLNPTPPMVPTPQGPMAPQAKQPQAPKPTPPGAKKAA